MAIGGYSGGGAFPLGRAGGGGGRQYPGYPLGGGGPLWAGFRGKGPGKLGKPPGPPKPPGQAPPAPGQAPGQTPGQNPAQGGQQSPLDATYYLNVGGNDLNTNNKINALNLQGSYDTTNLQAALGKLAYAQPRAQLALEQKANSSGGLYSSVYNQNLGNLNYNYLGQRGGLQDTYARNMKSIGSEIAGLQGGQGIYDLGQAYGSTQRAAAAAAANPALGQAPAPPSSGGTSPGAPPAAPPAPRSTGGKGGKGGKAGKGGKGGKGFGNIPATYGGF